MRFFLTTLALLFALSLAAAPAAAQVTLNLSAFAVTNNPQAAGLQNFGYGLGGTYKYDRVAVGLEALADPSRTNPRQATRLRAFADWKLAEWHGLTIAAGGGGWRTGADMGGFGHLRLKYDRLLLQGRYGNRQFTEAESAFEAIKTERFGIGPFYRFTWTQNFQSLHQAGLRLTLR